MTRMMRWVLCSLVLCGATGATAAQTRVSDWIYLGTKSVAVDQFAQWMRRGPLYRINRVDLYEETMPDGRPAARTLIIFDDARNCRGRLHETLCAPIDQYTLECWHTMNDCNGNGRGFEKIGRKHVKKKIREQR